MKHTIAIAQIAVELGNIQNNLATYRRVMKAAAYEGARLVIFPELSLTGYNLSSKLMNEKMHKEITDALSVIAVLSNELHIDVIVSYPTIMSDKERYITASYYADGELLSSHHKIYLADYGHCFDHLTFSAGSMIDVFSTRFGKVAMLICEDGWHPSTSIIAAQKGAEIIIDVAATSVVDVRDIVDMQYNWETVSKAMGLTQTSYFIYANRVGQEGDVIFWGGSHIVDPKGKIVKRAPMEKEEILFCQIDIDQVHTRRKTLPLVANELYGTG